MLPTRLAGARELAEVVKCVFIAPKYCELSQVAGQTGAVAMLVLNGCCCQIMLQSACIVITVSLLDLGSIDSLSRSLRIPGS